MLLGQLQHLRLWAPSFCSSRGKLVFIKPTLPGSVPVVLDVLQLYLPVGQMGSINSGSLKTIKKHF